VSREEIFYHSKPLNSIYLLFKTLGQIHEYAGIVWVFLSRDCRSSA